MDANTGAGQLCTHCMCLSLNSNQCPSPTLTRYQPPRPETGYSDHRDQCVDVARMGHEQKPRLLDPPYSARTLELLAAAGLQIDLATVAFFLLRAYFERCRGWGRQDLDTAGVIH
jgi:hypothetical protein